MNKQIQIIAQKEFKGLINNPIGGIFIFALVSISIFAAIELGQFIEFDEASLYSMFQFMPWILAFLIPILSMRILADENKNQTIELLLALPVKNYELILGKFIACFGIILIAILLSFPFWLIVNLLGNADNSVIFGGYIATLFLSCVYLSLCFAISLNIKTPAIAFLFASILCVFINSFGVPFINNFIVNGFKLIGIQNYINILALTDHYDNLIRGNFSFSALWFFTIIILASFYIAAINFDNLRKPNLKTTKSKFQIFFIIISIIILQIIGGLIFSGRGFDLTQDKIFTLNSSTKKFIKNSQSKIEIDFYFSKQAAAQNPNLRALGQNISDKLYQYANISQSKISYNEFNITQFSQNEELAIAKGLVPYNDELANLEPIYLGLIIKTNGKEFVFRRLNLDDFEQIEFSINKAILALSKNRRDKIAILSAQDWFVKKNDLGQIEPLSLIAKNLFQDYSVEVLEPNFKNLPDDLDILFIAQPWDLSDDEQYLIDQFAVKGGKLIMALDAFSSISSDNQIGKSQYSQSLGRLAANFGLIFSNQLVLDKENALNIYSQINGRQTTIQQPAYIKLGGTNVFGKINFATVSTFSKPNNGLEFVPIIQTSNQTMIMAPQDYSRDTSPQSILENWVNDGKVHIVAANIFGKINSSFEAQNMNFPNLKFEKFSTKPANIIAIADSDFLNDSLYINENIKDAQNANFIINIIEKLLGNQNANLLNTTPKPIRNLIYISQLKATANNDIIENENNLAQKIEEIELKISDLSIQNNETAQNEILQLKIQMAKTKNKLLATQNSIRRATENIKFIIIFICGIFTPLLFLIFTLFNFYRRNHGAKIAKNL